MDDMDFIVRDVHFSELAEVRPDAKKRIHLGRKAKIKARFFKVYQNDHGQILLDPQENVSSSEAWLFKNKKALHSVLVGLAQAKAGQLVDAEEDFSKYLDPEDR